MKHLSEGELRRMLDQPHLLAEPSRSHLQNCERCRTRAAAVVSAAEKAAFVMEGGGKVQVDPTPALQALKARGLGALSPAAAPAWWITGIGSRRVMRPVLGVAMVAVMGLTLVGTGVAGNLIKIFEPEEVVAVPVDLETLNSLPDLSRYGTITLVQPPEDRPAGSLEEAAEVTGLTLQTPSRMPQVTGAEHIETISRGTVSFTFDAAKAKAAGGELPDLPANIDGSSLFVEAGPVVVQVFGGPARPGTAPAADDRGELGRLLSSLPELMIVQMKSPVVSSNGPSVEDYREALLDMPGLSDALKAQVEAIGDPAATLPLPVPVDLATSREVDVNGATGLLVGDNTGVGSGVVWQSGGMVRAVGGTLAQDEVLAIARSMR